MKVSIPVRISTSPLLLTALLVGCVGQVDNPLEPVPPSGGRLYIANSGDSSLLIFGDILNSFGSPPPATPPIECIDSGPTPTRICNLFPTEKIRDLRIQDLIRNPLGVFVDTVNDRLYMADAGRNQILIFDGASTIDGNNNLPTRVISGVTTTLNSPSGLAVDIKVTTLTAAITPEATMIQVVSTAGFPTAGTISIENEIISYTGVSATSFTGVTRGAGGTTAANHSSGASVIINLLYVANMGGNDILVFDVSDAAFIPSPVCALSGPTTTCNFVSSRTISNLDQPLGLFLDSAGDRLYAANSRQNSILVFDNASNPTTLAPDRTITFSNNTSLSIPPLSTPAGVFVDVANDQLYVANNGKDSILVFNNSSSINGETIPARSVPSSPLNLSDPAGIFVDNNIRVSSGTATDGTATTLEDADINPPFIPNQFVNFLVEITGGLGQGQMKRITTNTDKVLTVSTPWLLPPNSSSTYQIRGDFIYVANQGNQSISVLDNASTVDASFFVVGNPTIASGSLLVDNKQTFTQDQFVNFLVEITGGPGQGQVRTITSNSSTQLMVYPDWTPPNPDTTSTYRIRPGLRTIIGTSTTLSSPGGIFLDLTANVLYVANSGNNSMAVFNNASAATGNVVPDRAILDAAAPPASPSGVFADIVNDRLYLASSGDNSILVLDHASTLQNSPPPVRRSISGASTTLNNPNGIFVDVANDQLYVSNAGASGPGANSILVFDNASTINSPVSPNRTISGLNNPNGVSVDTTRDPDIATIGTGILYVANTGANSILVFNNASNITDPIAPDQTISGSGLNNPIGVFVDTTRDILYVSNTGADTILVFNNASTLISSSTPDRTISSTTLNLPSGIFVDSENDLLYVANSGTTGTSANSILIFNNASNIPTGPATPDQILSGPATTLNVPLGIFVDTTR